MLLKDLIKEGTEILSYLYPEREAREMVLSYLGTSLGTTRHTHIVEPLYEVPHEAVSAFRGAFSRMAAGEPLQYVVGKAYFYGRKFNVTSDVLIPRPETEILCREACDFLKSGRKSGKNVVHSSVCYDIPESCHNMNPKILDLCTGSGCIAWTLALENPGVRVVAVDISDDTLAVACGQPFGDETARTGASAPHFVKADVLAGPLLSTDSPADVSSSCLSETDSPIGLSDFIRPAEMFPVDFSAGSVDVLVSNPPYVMDSEKALMRPNVLEHEPHLALFVSDEDPLVFYRAIADWASYYLKVGGFAVVEINEALGPQTAGIYLGAGFSDVRIIKDLNDRDRFVSFRK